MSQPVLIADIDLQTFFECLPKEHMIQPICIFEPIYEDLAFVVDEAVESDSICQKIEQLGKPLLQEARLFDVFRGERVGEGKKSLAFALTFQAMDRTLCDDDVAPVREHIIEKLKEYHALLRV